MAIPASSPYVVLGAGINGLSTGFHPPPELAAQVQEADLIAVAERQERIGCRSEIIVGEAEVDAHMKGLFPDWSAQGVTVCLHERQGGFAFNMASVMGLVGKCESKGVTVLSGVEVTGLELAAGDSVKAVLTSTGRIQVGDQLGRAPRPRAKAVGVLGGP